MNLTKRKYQEKALVDICQHISNIPVVLAAAPCAGKTLISLEFIEGYLKRFPEAKILVLTHGTTLLKNQFLDYLEAHTQLPAIEVYNMEDIAPSVVAVALPQTIHKQLKNMDNVSEIDLLIVDEAHEFYIGANKKSTTMVSKIIEKLKPKHQLLLTGTPAPFIEINQECKRFEIVPISLMSIMESDPHENVIHSATIELATSACLYDDDQFNSTFDLKRDFNFTENEVSRDLVTALGRILDRLQSIARVNPEVYNFTKAFPMNFCDIDKTIVACKDIAHAEVVERELKRLGVNCLMSSSENDIESDNVEKFNKDNDIKILVVIKRATLGYNNHNVVNFVDLTGTRNPSRLYQMYSRITRVHPDKKSKLFLKIVSPLDAVSDEYALTAALCLMDERWLMSFNGKNFGNLPVRKLKECLGVKYLNPDRQNDNSKYLPTKVGKPVPAQPCMYLSIPKPSEIMKAVYNKSDLALSSKSFAKLKNAQEALKKNKFDPSVSIDEIKASMLAFTHWHNWRKANPKYFEECTRRRIVTLMLKYFKSIQSYNPSSRGRPAKQFDMDLVDRAKREAKSNVEAAKILGCSEAQIRRGGRSGELLELKEAIKQNKKQNKNIVPPNRREIRIKNTQRVIRGSSNETL
jgi:superfamily II DNA or RNA helicase